MSNTFTLHLESATQYDHWDDAVSFVGEDASGSFGILAGHARCVTVLEFGLARFRTVGADWQFVAAPGAVLYYADNALHLSTRRYVYGTDVHAIRRALAEQLLKEETSLQAIKTSLRQLEEAMLRRLLALSGRNPSSSRVAS